MDKQETAKKKFPMEAKCYKILEEIGRGTHSIVYRALCISMNTTVAIKVINLVQSGAEDAINRSNSMLIHQNILNVHCSFFVHNELKIMWVVMPLMSAGSLLSILSASFPTGLSEECIADILLQTLNLMSYLHPIGILFNDIRPANIFLDLNNKAVIKFANICFPNIPPRRIIEEINEFPYWVPPEVYKSDNCVHGYTVKSDIWSLGILALELAQGKPPISNIPLPMSLTKMMSNRLFSVNSGECSYSDKRREFSKSFKDLVKQCLEKRPTNRASLETLKKHRFFERCKTPGLLLHDMLKDLPGEKDRNKFSSKAVEEEKKVEDVRSQSNISGWKLNAENLELFPTYSLEFNCNHDHDPPPPRVMGTETQGEKRVRFGGETVIMDNEVTMMDVDDDEEEEEEIVNELWDGISDHIQDIIDELEGMSRDLDEVCETTIREEVFLKLVLTRSNIEKQLGQLNILIDMHGEELKKEVEIQMESDTTFGAAMKPMKKL